MRTLLSSTLVAVVTSVAFAVPSPPSSEPGGSSSPGYIALGDSVASGLGAGPDGSGRYVEVLLEPSVRCPEAGECDDLDLMDLSAPGATSQTLVEHQLDRAVSIVTERRSDSDPDNDVALITVTIGGNDLFEALLAACRGGYTTGCRDVATDITGTYFENLHTILGSLREAAGPETEIVTMTYYNPLETCVLANIAPLADTILEGGQVPLGGFNDVIRVVAATHDVGVAEIHRLLGPGDYVGGFDCIHPSEQGHRKIARAFAGTLSGN